MTREGGEPGDPHRRMAHEVEDRSPADHHRDTPRPAVSRPRPIIERVGMAAIALVIAALFGGVGVAAFAGGEPFLGVMAAIGAVMTMWVGLATLVRG